ncbi:MAG: GNAT family N-acetyltransferase [Xanthomonadales bacterium]|nr:GNAT family N-acetyltransferase [Xanthomonadales bacterium]
MTSEPIQDTAWEFCLDDLSGVEIQALLAEHLANMRQWSPPESIHALDLTGLRAPGVSFWSAWSAGELRACGALQQLDAEHAEIKSMRTPAARRGQGGGRRMLDFLLAEAHRRGYRRLSLETGSQDGFVPARRLYASVGFVECGPFGRYQLDPHSVFMTLDLSTVRTAG